MSNSLDRYLDNLDGLIQQLTPAQTAALTHQIGQELRRRTAARIKANVAPDGSAFVRRQGEAWKARSLREGETLKPSQRFGFFKSHNLQLKNVINRDNRLVGVESTEGNPGYPASFLSRLFGGKLAQCMADLLPAQVLKHQMRKNPFFIDHI